MYGYGYGYGGWGTPDYGQPASTPSGSRFNRYQGNGQMVDASNSQKPVLQVPWVNGEVGAQAYFIAPNSSVLLMDSDNPVFYIKTSDMTGKAVIKSFKYEECCPGASTTSPSYVTREEFEAFKNSLLADKEEGKI